MESALLVLTRPARENGSQEGESRSSGLARSSVLPPKGDAGPGPTFPPPYSWLPHPASLPLVLPSPAPALLSRGSKRGGPSPCR